MKKSKKKIIIISIVVVLLVAVFIPLNSVWIGHIPKKYTYNSKLPKPSNIVSWADMNSSIVQNALKKRVKNTTEQLQNVEAPEGFVINKYKVKVDNSEIDMYSIEPKELVDRKDVPVVLYLHGGAFYFPLGDGDLTSMAIYSKELSARVFVPDYRTSLDNPFPTPMLDCYASLLYLENNKETLGINMDKLLIYGASAGGNLTAAVTQYSRDNNGPVAKGQILIYPVTDNSLKYDSMKKYEDAIWSFNANENMWKIYLADGDHGMLKYAAPMQSDDFSNLPRAYIEVSEIDVLHDEGLAYAEKLKNSKVEVETYEIPGGYHGFDADQSNSFVKKYINQRIETMKDMLK